MGRRHTKTDIVVEVVNVVVVADSAARVPLIIIEGTAAQHTAFIRSALPPEDGRRILPPIRAGEGA